jgi:glucose 1-dehydrogenase
MPDRFKGLTVLVTGASLGIGRAIAEGFGAEGANVVVNYYSSDKDAEEVVDKIKASGGDAFARKGDVSDLATVEAMVAEAVERFGKLDIAVSNAVYSDREIFFKAEMKGFRRTIDVTMWGAFHTLLASTKQMIQQGHGGNIVIVSSPHAYIPAPRAMAYNMSKAAIEHMARTAAIETAEHRIRINVVQPGWTDTPGERKFASEDTLQVGGSKIPLGRLGTPEEMARGVLFLADPASDYITGSTLLIDGGITLPWWASRGSAAPG